MFNNMAQSILLVILPSRVFVQYFFNTLIIQFNSLDCVERFNFTISRRTVAGCLKCGPGE
jgi:hypothetical protein